MTTFGNTPFASLGSMCWNCSGCAGPINAYTICALYLMRWPAHLGTPLCIRSPSFGVRFKKDFVFNQNLAGRLEGYPNTSVNIWDTLLGVAQHLGILRHGLLG